MSRIQVSKRIRFEVFKRDQFTCQYCGKHPPEVMLECDHIVPVVEGGGNDDSNLVTACQDCNRGKAAIPLEVMPRSLDEKAAEIQEREAQIAGFREIMQARLDRIEDDKWQVATALFPDTAETPGVRRDWLRSIVMFIERLPLHDVIEAAELAHERKSAEFARFKYFCGICWNKIKDGQ